MGYNERAKEPVNGGEQHSGVILLVSNESGVVVCFGLGERLLAYGGR